MKEAYEAWRLAGQDTFLVIQGQAGAGDMIACQQGTIPLRIACSCSLSGKEEDATIGFFAGGLGGKGPREINGGGLETSYRIMVSILLPQIIFPMLVLQTCRCIRLDRLHSINFMLCS